jgi:hypothetical protein
MKYVQLAGGILAILLLIGLGVFIGNKTKQCAEMKLGKETTTVTITVHDTITNIKTVNQIQYQQQIHEVVRSDTLHDTITTSKTQDTTNCFSFDENEKDGAYIKASVCSDSFKFKPADLRGEILYKAAPDTMKQTFRVDTISRVKEPAPFKSWKDYALVILAAVLAASFIPHH